MLNKFFLIVSVFWPSWTFSKVFNVNISINVELSITNYNLFFIFDYFYVYLEFFVVWAIVSLISTNYQGFTVLWFCTGSDWQEKILQVWPPQKTSTYHISLWSYVNYNILSLLTPSSSPKITHCNAYGEPCPPLLNAKQFTHSIYTIISVNKM